MSHRGWTQRTRGRQRGAALLVALVCLMIATSLVIGWLTSAAAARKQSRQDQWRLQAQWLCESGISRAAARLAADPEYHGESWSLTAEQLGGKHGGQVAIAVAAVEARPNSRRVDIIAQYPSGNAAPVCVTKQVFVDLPVRRNES